jgi:hypothetical protein
MSFAWRTKLLFSAGLLLTGSGIVAQTPETQINGIDRKGDADHHGGLQVAPSAQRDILVNQYRISEINGSLGDQTSSVLSLDLAVPLNNGAGLEDSLFHVVNVRGNANESAALPLPKPPDPSEQGWHVAISPYLWFAGLHGTVGTMGHEASVHASFSDIFSYLNIGLMVAVEPRYNRIVMPFDFMWMKLSDDKSLAIDPGTGPPTIKLKVNQDILTQKIGYRVVDAEKFKVDALVGFRYWHAGTTLTVEQSSPQTNPSFYTSSDWVDAVGGARIEAMLSPRIILTIAGDAGGGGANSDYQVGGLIGWKLKKVVLQAGYRYLSVNYRPGGSVYDVTMSGLLLGVTIPLK